MHWNWKCKASAVGAVLLCTCMVVGAMTAGTPSGDTPLPDPSVKSPTALVADEADVQKPESPAPNADTASTPIKEPVPIDSITSYVTDMPDLLQMTNLGKELPVRSTGHDLRSGAAAAKAGIRGTGVLCAWTEADVPAFRSALSALLGGDPVDYYDARVDTPSVELMQDYAAVLTWVNYPYADNVLMGDNLADYVDAGGKAILGQWCYHHTQNNWLEGRIMDDPNYCPITADMAHFTNSCYAGDGVTYIHQGVTEYCSDYRDNITGTQGYGALDGTWLDGNPIWGYQAAGPNMMRVFYASGHTGGMFGTGEWPLLTYNVVFLCTPEPMYGACCNELTGDCIDGVELMDCIYMPGYDRWEFDTLCDDLDPPCGQTIGACCWGDEPPHYYECEGDMPLAECVALGETTTWHEGESCDDPTFECPGAPSYCDPCYTNHTDDWIANVTLAEINNTTGIEDDPCSYGDYCDQQAFVLPGTTVPMTVGVGTSPPGHWTQCVAVWVDWNQDYEFDNSTERYDGGCGRTAGTEVWWTSFDIIVPGDALPNDTTMRVVERYYSLPPDACEEYSYGEVEDYTVFVGEAQGGCCVDYDPYCFDDVLEGDCDDMGGTFLGHAVLCSTLDCNDNGVPDNCDIATGTSLDCQPDGIPDECQVDCNGNGVPDDCDIADGTSPDCNENGFPDECDIPPLCDPGAPGFPDECSWDVDGSGVPDECQEDCNDNGILDLCDITCDIGDCGTIPGCGQSEDCQPDGIPDDCQVPPECGEGPSSGDCCYAHPTAGCEDPVCEASVRSYDSYCCTYQWDGVCASEAAIDVNCYCDKSGSRDVMYQHDDGTHEDSIGLSGGGYVAWMNHFVTEEDGGTITEIHISYGMVDAGMETSVILWSDPNQDGDPTDGQVLAMVGSTVVNPDVDFFVVVDIPDTDVGEPGTHFFVGAVMWQLNGNYPAAIDQTSTAVQSWVAAEYLGGPADPNDLGAWALPPELIDNYLPGNWLIRAVGSAGAVADCNGNCIPDDCDIMYCYLEPPDEQWWCQDCNLNGCPDEGDLPDNDCDENLVPDDCQIADCPPDDYFCQDCDEDGILDGCQLEGNDCNSDLIPDNCQLEDNDCNDNGIPDECEVPPICPDCPDCEPDGIPDDCADDCNDNGIPDFCDIRDCDTSTPFEEHFWCLDCQPDGFPDGCQIGWDCGGGGDAGGTTVRNDGAILYTPSHPDDAAWRAQVAAITGGVVDYFDPRTTTPTLETLSDYDLVYTWVNYAYADNVAMGDVLADYVDGGGRVVLGQWCLPALSGRIMDPAEGYLPVTGWSSGSGDYADDGTGCFTEEVHTWSTSYRDNASLLPGAENDGTYTDGVPLVAFYDGVSVAYMPGVLVGYGTGDNAQLIANALTCVGGISGEDCNLNCIPDECDIAYCDGSYWCSDCNDNDIPDGCEPDCNGNEQADECDIDYGVSEDCNENEIPDECDVPPLCEAGGYGFPEECSADCQPDIVPDECQLEDNDCNENEVPDECDIADGTSEDCQLDGTPDECQLWQVREICGDGCCMGEENYVTCPEDCPPPVCGNGICEPPEETCETCPEDCGECPSCADFVVTAPGSWSGTTCGMGDLCRNRTTEDVVYQVEILEGGQWDFSLCDSSFDTYLLVGDSDCCSWELGAVDDSCGLQSNIVALVDPGTYYVTIEGYSSCGNYVLDTVFLGGGPEVDYYVDAPGVWSGTTCGMGNDCPNRASLDVNYAVTIPYDDTWHISLCDSSFNTYLFVGTAGVCSQDIDATNDDCGVQSETVAYLTAGEYFVDIEAYGSATCGNYVLDVFSEGRSARDELYCQHVIPDDTGAGGLIATASSTPHGYTSADNFTLEAAGPMMISQVEWQMRYYGYATDCPGDDLIDIRFYRVEGGGPPTGDCCQDHYPVPGCEDPDCEASVCSYDPYCCTSGWDDICAAEAMFDPACDCGTGDCCQDHYPEPGCNDPECEASVCSYDPYCCTYGWDSICVAEAMTDPACDCPSGGWTLVAEYLDVPHTKELHPRPWVFGVYPVYNFVGELSPCFMVEPGQEYYVSVTSDPSVDGCPGIAGWMASPDVPPGDATYWQDTGAGFMVGGYAADLAFCLYGMPAGAPPNDCNENGVPDECDISTDFGPWYYCDPEVSECSLDCNYNCIPDECDETVEPYELELDIKPGSCPNSFNRDNNGVLPISLVGTEEWDMMDVDISTLRLSRADGVGGELAPIEGPPGPHTVYEDVSTPFYGEGCECAEGGPDGMMDISMKFDTELVNEVLEMADLMPGALVPLVVTGNLNNGCAFVAYDCVRLVPPGSPPGLLMVTSDPSTSAWVDCEPLDLTLDGGGWTEFQRGYPTSTVVTLRAEERFGDLRLVGWYVDGVFQTRDNSLRVTMPADTVTATVVYQGASSTHQGPTESTSSMAP